MGIERYFSQYTGAEIDKATAYRLIPPTEDIVDGVYVTGSTRAITADTEYKLIFDDENLARHFTNGFEPAGLTKMWDFINNVSSYSEFTDTPVIVALPNCYFKPTSANPGECIIRMYVNETVPILMDQAIVGFQGTVYEKMGDLFSYYLGDETGYQVKTKGVYWTFEFSLAGDMIDMGLMHYLT